MERNEVFFFLATNKQKYRAPVTWWWIFEFHKMRGISWLKQ